MQQRSKKLNSNAIDCLKFCGERNTELRAFTAPSKYTICTLTVQAFDVPGILKVVLQGITTTKKQLHCRCAVLSLPLRLHFTCRGQTTLIDHLGQVCTLCTFYYQTLHTALDRCLDHFKSKTKMSKCHIVTSYLMTSQKLGLQYFWFQTVKCIISKSMTRGL